MRDARSVTHNKVLFFRLLTSSCKTVEAASQQLTIFQSSCHTLAQAPDPSLVLEQVSYWLNIPRRLRHHRLDSGA